ncbi:MAG: hypothetical protein GY711_04340 [bacterium]|nr:hypothetical protein [bacterium]
MLRSPQHLGALLCLAASAAAQGSFTTDGQGCPQPTSDSGPVLYGVLPAGGWHLDHASLRFVASPMGSWSLSPGGSFREPSQDATLLPLGDEALTGPLDLGFTFTYPGGAGSTTAIDVNSNGRVYLEAGTNPWPAGWSAEQTLPDFLAATPSVCVLGTDINTGAAGIVSFEVQSADTDQVALVTWDGVPEYPNIGASTCQVQLWSTGEVVLSYRDTTGTGAERSALVGVSAGGGAADPGSSSLALPLSLWQSGGLPRIGDSITISVNGVPLSATNAVLGLGPTSPAAHWSGWPLPDCRQLIVPVQLAPMELTPPTAQVTLPWVYDPALVGYTVHCQAFVTDPQLPSSAPTLVSNRGALTLGEPPDLAFVAEGANSYYGSPLQLGYFRLESSPGASHADVERLELLFTDTVHDFDTVGNAGLDGQGFFSDGDGQGPSCHNAYYGSDVTTGLVYGGPLQGSGCDGTGTTGWVGGNPVGTSLTRFRQVVFEFDDFSAGEIFRFDCDTDGGGFHAGALPLAVTVELSNGTTFWQVVQVVSHERAEGVLIQ